MGRAKVIASCSSLVEKACSRKEGVGLATNVETFRGGL